MVEAVLQVDALLLIHVSFLLRLLQLLVHHTKDLRVFLKVTDGLLRLDLAVFGGVSQPSYVEFKFVILIFID